MREQLANNASTTLSSSATSGATTISVASAASFPSTGNFRLICGSEIMLCTGVSGTTFTVVRGYESTTGASHASGSTVSQVLTAGSLVRNRQDDYHLASGSQPPVGRLLDASGNTLTSSSFTATASGSTITDQAGTIVLSYPALALGGFDFATLLRSAPSTPYSIVTATQASFYGSASTAWWYGLVLADGTGAIISHGFFMPNTGLFQVSLSKMNSGSSESANYSQALCVCQGLYQWLKITDSGTNLTFYFSADGVNWNQTYQVSRTDWLTAGPTQVGLFATTTGTAPSDGSSATGIVTFAAYQEG
jgi:hypothetical protein